jgi:hypothetical protein
MSLMGTASPRCPLCGDPRHACGQPSDAVPVDERIERSNTTMAELKRYNVTVNGHNTVMQLTAEKAAAMGGTPYTPPPPTPKPEQQAAVITGLQTELDDANAEIERLTAELKAAATTKADADVQNGATDTDAAASEESPKAAEPPANKSRRPQNKAR